MINRKEIGARIYDLRVSLKLNQEAFIKEFKISRSQLSQIERGVSAPSLSMLQKIVNDFHISYDWIIDGRGSSPPNISRETIKNGPPMSPPKKEKTISDMLRMDDIIGETKSIIPEGKYHIYIKAPARAGLLVGFTQEFLREQPKIPLLPGFEDCSIIIPVEGDSMYPIYPDSTLVICKEVEKLEYVRWGEPYLILADDGHVVKFVHPVENKKDRWLLVSENDLYKPYEIELKRVRKIWLVKGYITKSTRRKFLNQIQ